VAASLESARGLGDVDAVHVGKALGLRGIVLGLGVVLVAGQRRPDAVGEAPVVSA